MKISFSRQTKERAFKQLYEDYYAPFCLYAKRFVDDKEVREDIPDFITFLRHHIAHNDNQRVT